MNDEDFSVRCGAMSIIARLAPRNPAHILSFLRKVLLQLLQELQYGGDNENPRVRQEASELIGKLISGVFVRGTEEFDRKGEDVEPDEDWAWSKWTGATRNKHAHSIIDATIFDDTEKSSPTFPEIGLTSSPRKRHYDNDASSPHTPRRERMERKDYVSLLEKKRLRRANETTTSLAWLRHKLMLADDQAVAFIGPFISPMMRILMKVLPSSNVGTSTAVLWTLGEIALVPTIDTKPYLGDLLPKVIDALRDHSSDKKRCVALRTLGLLVRSTGEVARPLKDHPDLCDTLLSIINGATAAPWPLRREAIKTLGILGALDPFKYRMSSKSQPRKIYAPESGDAERSHLTASSDDYFPTVAIQALQKVLKDPSLAMHHSIVVQAITHIFRSLGLQCAPFLPSILPQVLSVMRTCENDLRRMLFQQQSIIVAVVKQHIRPYLDGIFELIKEFWHENLEQILTLIEEINLALKDEFNVYIGKVLPLILRGIKNPSPRMRPVGRRSIQSTGAMERKVRESSIRKCLHTLSVLGPNLSEHLHLVVPVVTKIVEQSGPGFFDAKVRVAATSTLCVLANCRGIQTFISRCIHLFLRVLRDVSFGIQDKALDALALYMAKVAGTNFRIFAPMVDRVLLNINAYGEIDNTSIGRSLARYRATIDALESSGDVPPAVLRFAECDGLLDNSDGGGFTYGRRSPGIQEDVMGSVKILQVNQAKLKKVWEATQRSTKEDWAEWMRRLTVELLRESPSPALRSCSSVAQIHTPLARELFNAAFVSCWNELHEQYQKYLISALEEAFCAPTIPPEILQALLNLAEFMEHDDHPLPIDIRKLGEHAQKCHAYAKALHYKEMEFRKSPDSDCVEALVSINNQLEQPEAAVGIIRFTQQSQEKKMVEDEVRRGRGATSFMNAPTIRGAGLDDGHWEFGGAGWSSNMKRFSSEMIPEGQVDVDSRPASDGFTSIRLQESWFEKLGRWEDGLSSYEKRLAEDSLDVDASLGRLRCLEALGEFVALEKAGQSIWPRLYGNPSARQKLAPILARAAWSQGHWEAMEQFVSQTNKNSIHGCILRCILALQHDQFDKARRYIKKSRHVLDTALGALVGESYSRAYRQIVVVQQLAELEEIYIYKRQIAVGCSQSAQQRHEVKLRKIWGRA